MAQDMTARTGALPPDDGRDAPLSRWWAVAVVAVAAGVVFVAGANSDVVKGDEVYHFSFAEAWAHAGILHRPAFNPFYPSGEAGYYYAGDMFWGMLCSLVWQVTGIHQWAAQGYQAAWYALLLAMVYRLGRHLLGPRGALVALLAAASMPMFTAFSVLLYVDVPGAAILLTALVLVHEKHLVCAGLALGAAYLTKRNTFFLVPALALVVAWPRGPILDRAKRLALLFAPAALVVGAEWLWRRGLFPPLYDPLQPKYLLARLGTFFSRQQLVSNLNNPLHLVAYYGPVVSALAVLYVVRRAWQRADRWLWALLAGYTVVLMGMFSVDTEVRYTMPAAPLVAVLAARGFSRWWRRPWLLAGLAAAALASNVATAAYVNRARLLSPSQQAVFQYLRTETPEDTRILYPGEVIVTHARRQGVWSQLVDPDIDRRCITLFVAEKRPEKIRQILRHNRVDYVCVEEARIHQDSDQILSAGYPRSFVERLDQLPFLHRLPGDRWPGIRLYRVRHEPDPPPPHQADDPVP